MKIKYRKCPECSGKMVLRKSGKGNKFWGCTTWKDTGCNGSAPHYDGARAGLDVVIREIDNGYVVSMTHKFAPSVDDEIPVETYCPDKEVLKALLSDLMQKEAEYLYKQTGSSTEFVDEIDSDKHEKRVKIARKGGTKDVKKLLAQLKNAKEEESE